MEVEFKAIPVLGIIIEENINNLENLKKIISNIDYPVTNLVIINNGNINLDKDLDKLLSESTPYVNNISISHIQHKKHLFSIYDSIIRNYINEEYYVLLNDNEELKKGYLEELAFNSLNKELDIIYKDIREFKLNDIKSFLIKKCTLDKIGFIDDKFEEKINSKKINIKNLKLKMEYYNDSDPESQWGIIDTNKFKVNKNLSKRFFCVDNFYEDPHGVRELALSAEYFEGEGAVGSRTRKQFLFEGVKERFEEIIGEEILETTPDGMGWRDGGINGRFQTCEAGTKLVYHCDAQMWAGMVYLTPDAPPQCGTTFFRHKETKIRHNSEIDWEAGEGLKVFNQKTFLDGTPYEQVDKVGNVFNRLVIFDGGLIHSASEYFGWDIQTSRLFHMFFFNTENKK